MSNTVTCCRSSEVGKKGGPNETSSMRRWVLNRHWRKSGLWLDSERHSELGLQQQKNTWIGRHHLLEDIRWRGRLMVRGVRSENASIS